MSENTCNAILTAHLNKKGVKAFFERHFTTLEGIKKPDVFIERDGYYFVEGKQRPQAQLIHAVSKAHIYKESVKSTVPAKAVFAVLYPENCQGPCEAAVLMDSAPYYIEQRTKTLEELSDWIKSFTETPSIPAEINTAHAIRLLQQAVDAISYAFTKLEIAEIDEIFGGKTFFESVLGYEEEDDVPKQHLRMAAAYLLVNQIMFYQVLARETNDYDILDSDKVEKPSELQSVYFAKVLLKDYRPIFDFDIVTKLKGQASLEAVKTTINAINALSPEKHGHDILGKIFHNLIPFEIRKSVAAFFTNSEAAELLASLAIDSSDAAVIDPACGSGTLLVAAYHRKKELMEKTKFGPSDHNRFLTKQITGIDIMPFSAHLSAVHLALQAPLFETDNVRIAIHDSTSLTPDRSIDAAQETLKEAYKTGRISDYFEGHKPKDDIRRRTVKGSVTLTEKKAKPFQLGQVEVAIMNPPFTRHERIPDEYKTLLQKRFSDYSKLLHGQIGLHGYFILLGDKFLMKNGRLALVLPATLLRLRAAEQIRRMLLSNYHIEYLITTGERSAFSESAHFREILMVARKLKNISEDSQNIDYTSLRTSIIELKTLPHNANEARALANKIKALHDQPVGEVFQDDILICQSISQQAMKDNADNLYQLVSSGRDLSTLWQKFSTKARQDLLVPFGNIVVIQPDIQRFDYAPPNDETFVHYNESRTLKKKDVWVIKEVTNQKVWAYNRFVSSLVISIPLKCLRYGLRRPSWTSTLDISNSLDLIISDNFPDLERVYLDKTKRNLFLRNIIKWKSYIQQRAAHVAISRKLNIAAPGTKLIAYFSQFPFTGVDMWNVKNLGEDDAKILSLWLNSTPNLLQVMLNRTEIEGGWMKINEYQVTQSKALNIGGLTAEDRRALIAVFERVKDTEFPSVLEQLVKRNTQRVEIDKTILKILGFSGPAIEKLLDEVYTLLGDEIQKLKDMTARTY